MLRSDAHGMERNGTHVIGFTILLSFSYAAAEPMMATFQEEKVLNLSRMVSER